MASSDPAPTVLTTRRPAGHTPERSDRLIGRWTRVHFSLLLVALVLLVIAGTGQHFLYDEWAFVGGKLDSLALPGRYLLPHNEHWSLLPLLTYRALAATVGLGSYWPYLGLLLLLHLGVTHLLWQLMLLAGSRPIVATALAGVFSVLGAAAEDLVWAFQIGFVGSTLLGLAAVYLAVTGTASWRRTCVLATLVLAGLATSGIGLAYLIVVPLALALGKAPRRFAVGAFVMPLLVYLPWYAVYGRSLAHPPTASIAAPLLVGAFAILGLTSSLTGYLGFGTGTAFLLLVGVPVLAGLAVTSRDLLAQRTAAGRAPLAMSIGAIAFFGATGLARAGFGLGFATSSRYIYVAMALLLPAVAGVISRATEHHPAVVKAVVPIALAVAVSNVFQLMSYAADTRQQNDSSRRILVAASQLARGRGPIFADQAPEPWRAPDLSVTDLRSGHLDAALDGITPQRSDRLAASLNLQIRVVPTVARARASTCRKTIEQQVTVTTGQQAAARFFLSTDAPLVLSLKDPGSSPAQRTIVLASGTYLVESLREAGSLSIRSPAGVPLLAAC